jgi:fibronectin type 3 domain-containing protein
MTIDRLKKAALRGAITLGAAFGLAISVLATGSDGTPAVASGGACQASGPTTGAYTATVCITDPADGSAIIGNATIAATVSFTGTGPGVRRVVFYIDGAYLLTDYTTPYTFVLPTAKLVDGVHLIEAESLLRDNFTTDRAAVSLTFNNGVTQPPVNTNTFTPSVGTTPAPGKAFVVGAVGDGAGGDPSADNVTNLVSSWNPNLFLYLGDVYEKGSMAEFYNWYGTTNDFSRFRAITDPTIGNHEYTAGLAPGYFDNWDNVPHYYSYNAGGWHFISLDSNNNPGFNGQDPTSAQYKWLQSDLQANHLQCTIAYFHHPLYNIGNEPPSVGMAAIWSLLEQKGVDAVVNGHDHTYQRWTPMDASGNPDPHGMPEFIDGTGGHALGTLPGTDSRMLAGFTQFGAFRLELNQSGAAYQYVTTNGDVLDYGSFPCRGTAADVTAPTVPTGLTTSTPWRGEIDLNWTESTDNVGVTGYDIYRNGVLLTTAGPQTTYQDLAVSPSTTYTYQVRARDNAGNTSALSTSASATTPELAVLFSDGFENGLGQWINNGLTLQQQDVLTGSWAAEMTSTGVGAAYADHVLSSPVTDLYYETRFKILSQGPNSVTLLRLRSTTTSILTVFVSTTDKLGYRNDAVTPGVATTSATASVSLNTWHTAQVHVTVNDTSSLVEVWLDGIPVADLSRADSLGTIPIARIGLGDNSASSKTYDIALDDVEMDPAFIPDTAAPTTPLSLHASAPSGIEVDLSWTASTDDVGVTGYDVFRDGALLAAIGAAPAFADTTVSPHTSYYYQVRARDAAGNASAESSLVTLVTPAVFTDDFESGDLSRWPGVSGLTVQQEVVANGTSAARAISSGTGASAYRQLVSGQSDLYYRLRFDVVSQGANSVNLARVRTSTGGAVTTMLVTSTGKLGYRNDVTGLSYTSTVGVSSGWHELQFHVFVNDTASEVEVWLDGVPVSGLTRQDSLGTSPIGRVELGDTSTGRTFDVAFDDVLVDTDFIGDSIPPSIPTDLAVSSVTATRVSLTWTASTDTQGVAGYEIRRNGALVGDVGPVTSYDDLSVSLGATYTYTVRAFDNGGNISQASAPVNVTVIDTVPPTPATLGGTASSDTEIDLTWSGATDDVKVTGYQLLRDGSLIATLGVVTSYQDTGLVQSSTHTYAVYALDAAGNISESSNLLTITCKDVTPPTAPTAPAATAVSATEIDVSWTASTDNSGVAGYTVFRGGVQIGTVAAPATAYIDLTVLPLTSYTYTIQATDAAGNISPASAGALATTPSDTTPPTAPTVIATPISGTQVGLTWSGATDNVGITRYTVFRDGKKVIFLGGGIASYTDFGLVSATTYVYTIRASDAAGNQSVASVPVSATTLDSVPPSAPTGLTAALVVGPGASLAWTASNDNVGVTGYVVFRNAVQIASVGPSPTTYTDSPLPGAGTFTYTVKATDAAGNMSAASNPRSVSITDMTPPTAPSGLAATPSAATEIDLTWSASTDDVGVARYLVYRGASQIGTVTAPTTRYNDTSAVPTTTYTYTVKAADAAGNVSPPSPDASATTPADTTAPTVPAGVTATIKNSSSVLVSWSSSTDDVGVTAYTVKRDGNVIATTGVVTSYTDNTATGGTAYSYTLAASDAAANTSAASAAANVTTPLFADNFETGNLSLWAAQQQMNVQGQQIHAGTYAARGTSTGSPAYAVAQLSSSQTSIYWSSYIRILSNKTAAGLLEVQTAGGVPVVTFYVTDKGKLSFTNDVLSTTFSSPANFGNGWHQLKVHVSVNGASSQVQVWLDGGLVNQLNVTTNLGSAAIGKVLIGDTAAGRTYDIAFDDVIADTRP